MNSEKWQQETDRSPNGVISIPIAALLLIRSLFVIKLSVRRCEPP